MISHEIAATVIGDIMKRMVAHESDRTDEDWHVLSGAFRKEQFCRKVRRAEHGCKASAEWTLAYYEEIVTEAKQLMESDLLNRSLIAKTKAEETQRFEDDFKRGIVSNPRYQAFLNTVEDPESVLHKNHLYIEWIAERTKEWREGMRAFHSHSDYFDVFSNSNLSERVKLQRKSSGT